MSMSGIKIEDSVVPLFNDMKLRSTNKYVLFKIQNKKAVVVDEAGDPCKTSTKVEDKAEFDKMKANLIGNQPRYILYDFGFTSKEGRAIKKLAFIFWCDDNEAKIGDKMIYASTKDTIKKCFSGLSLEFQANQKDDLDYDKLSDEVEKKA